MKESIHIPVSIDLAKEFVEWASDKSFCNSGQHVCDRLANFLESYIEDESYATTNKA